jgi:hypothetical protein
MQRHSEAELASVLFQWPGASSRLPVLEDVLSEPVGV